MKRQTEFEMDDMQSWERGKGEPPCAYAAFCTYRELGPGRTLYGAYRAWKEKKSGPTPNASKLRSASGARIAPSATWKKWRDDYCWDKRAAAYDRSREAEQRARIEESRRLRVEELLQSEAAERERIQLLTSRLAEREAGSLAKTQAEIDGVIITRDPLREISVLSKELDKLKQRRYAPIESLLTLNAEKGQREQPDVAGTFSYGDRMWGGSAPPPLPGDANYTPEPVPEEKRPGTHLNPGPREETGLMEQPKLTVEAEAAEQEIDPLIKILTYGMKK